MPRKIKTPDSKEKIKKRIVSSMESLGTYKPEYDSLINILSGLLHQYEAFEREFEASGYQVTEEYTNKAGATNDRKIPIYTAMESLRKDIALYSDKLCLNPKALETVTVNKEGESKLGKALRRYK